MMKLPIAIFAILLNFCGCGDVFTSIAHLESLLSVEAGNTADQLLSHISAEEARLDELERRIEEYADSLSSLAKADPAKGTYGVDNPINAFLLIKWLTKDWPKIQRLMEENPAVGVLANISAGRAHVEYPNEEDLDGAATALLRLQDTFRLSTVQLANGNVDGERAEEQLSAADCFDIGRVAYNEGDFHYTIEWIKEALERGPDAELEAQVLPYYAFALDKQGNRGRALHAIKRLAELEPKHPMVGELEKAESAAEDESDLQLPLLNPHTFVPDNELSQFQRLCRGEQQVPTEGPSKLYSYLKRDTPFLKLAPFKVELLHIRPVIALFHDVMSRGEIATLRRLSRSKLQRAKVNNPSTGTLELTSNRISKTAWFRDKDHALIARLSRRYSDMTNLDLETAENLQVANYGMGGHYEPHYDFTGPNDELPLSYVGKGNRIATVLTYMSTPKKGGHTAFQNMGVRATPVMGSAVLWYHLRRDGQVDYRSLHAACPVLVGQKWSSNKAFHERGQEFLRPCALNPEVEEQFVGDNRAF